MFSSPAFAQATEAAQQPGMLETFAPMIMLFVLLWFIFIRPQNKRMKEHREMVANVKRGDTVVTSGGVVGKVTKVKDEAEVEVEIAKDVKVTVVKSTIADVRTKGEPVKADDDK